MVPCPVCNRDVSLDVINKHLDSNCNYPKTEPDTSADTPEPPKQVSSFFQTPSTKKSASQHAESPSLSQKRPIPLSYRGFAKDADVEDDESNPPKKQKTNTTRENLRSAMPLAERMRPKGLDDIHGQELVGEKGILRGLIKQGRVPSMILWGAAGCGKTTIARVIAAESNSRFVEISATASGVGDCKKIFAEARSELALSGRKTILFCDEIHRFTKTQQDVFLAPVEKGEVVLIGATTENPSFKVQDALLSRCRTFTLSKLSQADVETILRRALLLESPTDGGNEPVISELLDTSMIEYLARFADGDARTALNLLELAINLSTRHGITADGLKKSLAQTLVYDRAGDAHYDTISAFHKSIRGGNPDGALFWLSRMILAGEDPLFIARRMVVMASEDIGLADNSMLPLATSTFSAVQQIGMPEARINLAHCAVALALAKKSVRAYRGLGKAMEAYKDDPALSGAPVPVHLRNAPTKLMKELGYGEDYKYNPNYKDGRVKQEYLPKVAQGMRFLEDIDLGTAVDLDLQEDDW